MISFFSSLYSFQGFGGKFQKLFAYVSFLRLKNALLVKAECCFFLYKSQRQMLGWGQLPCHGWQCSLCAEGKTSPVLCLECWLQCPAPGFWSSFNWFLSRMRDMDLHLLLHMGKIYFSSHYLWKRLLIF